MTQPEPDDMPMEHLREGLAIFLRGVNEEVHADDWTPTASEIDDLWKRLSAQFHEWLIAVGRHP